LSGAFAVAAAGLLTESALVVAGALLHAARLKNKRPMITGTKIRFTSTSYRLRRNQARARSLLECCFLSFLLARSATASLFNFSDRPGPTQGAAELASVTLCRDVHLILISVYFLTPTRSCICAPLDISKVLLGEVITVSLFK
jgi:hypothetical protein